MKKGTISSLLAGLLLTSLVTPTLAATPTFKDVGASFAKGEIESLHKSGVITGDDKGNFNPTRSMTREEFAVLLSNAMGLSPNATAAASFTDVDKWARPYVGALVTAQITGGYDATHFGGRDLIT
ncbi:MAG: S-layer homology domain-containing protein, partial [Tumebacillaceae bacterium]